MGLDSVELVIEWEDFFEIKIPDNEAGKMRTVRDAVEFIASQVKYTDRNVDIKADIIRRLTTTLSEIDNAKLIVSVDQKIFEIAPFADQSLWKNISEKLNYELPYPTLTGKFGQFIEKIFPTKVDFENTTVDRFADLICAVNYKTLLEKGKVQNKYEVLIGIMGMTIDKLGINPFEVFQDKSFVDDFGID